MHATLTVSCSLRSARIGFGLTRCLMELFQKRGFHAHCWASQQWHPMQCCLVAIILRKGARGSRQNVVLMWFKCVWFLSRGCPNLARFCPIVAGFEGEHFAMGSKCSSGKRVKIDGDSGAPVSPVRCVPVHAGLSRARARLGPTYGSAEVDQGQIVQRDCGRIIYLL